MARSAMVRFVENTFSLFLSMRTGPNLRPVITVLVSVASTMALFILS
jgi:hypothetical protein